MDYTKPWLSIDEQIGRLSARGVHIHSHDEAAAILEQVGAFRMRLGYILGQRSTFAHEDVTLFTKAFTAPTVLGVASSRTSSHADLLAKIEKRKTSSDEDFVTHFRDKYENRMPIWALTEILELGQLDAPKQFGAYSAFAVMVYFLRSIDPTYDWPRRMRQLLRTLPTPDPISPASVGFRPSWLEEDLWSDVAKP